MSTHIYLVVRTDLSKEQQLVQACHAILKAGLAFNSNPQSSLVVLGVENKTRLYEVSSQLEDNNIKFEKFYESWANIGHTALATEPINKQVGNIFSNLELLKY